MSHSTQLVDERWFDNEIFYRMRRVDNYVGGGVIVFIVAFSLMGFYATGNALVFLIMFIMLTIALLMYSLTFWIPQRVGLFVDGLTLQHKDPIQDRTFSWKEIGRISARKKPPRTFDKSEVYSLTFWDHNNRKMMGSPLVVSRAVYEGIKGILKERNLDLLWQPSQN